LAGEPPDHSKYSLSLILWSNRCMKDGLLIA
jgi:hypothetical protein